MRVSQRARLRLLVPAPTLPTPLAQRRSHLRFPPIVAKQRVGDSEGEGAAVGSREYYTSQFKSDATIMSQPQLVARTLIRQLCTVHTYRHIHNIVAITLYSLVSCCNHIALVSTLLFQSLVPCCNHILLSCFLSCFELQSYRHIHNIVAITETRE